jgi:hypothetical protein
MHVELISIATLWGEQTILSVGIEILDRRPLFMTKEN